MEWEHTTFGASTNQSTKDYRCQGCGAWFVKRPKSEVIVFWVVGVLLSIPCLFGAPFLYLAWRQSTFDSRLPLVPGALAPRLRFPGGAPKRTCGKCGGIAKALRITRHTHKGMPTGTDYEYVCGQCGLEFATENFLGHAFSTVSGTLLGGVAAGFFFGAQSPALALGRLDRDGALHGVPARTERGARRQPLQAQAHRGARAVKQLRDIDQEALGERHDCRSSGGARLIRPPLRPRRVHSFIESSTSVPRVQPAVRL